MKKPILLAAALAVAALPIAAPAPASAATATAKKKHKKECQFTKKKAKRKKAPLCEGLSDSRWIVVSGGWHEKLQVEDADGNATFKGTGQSDLEALGLNGDSAFPSAKQPVVSMVSTRRAGVTFSASSKGGWTDGNRFFDCSFTAPADSKPNGFGGIFSLKGKSVAVQWLLGATGFGCADGPYPTPSPDFPDPVSSYPLASFQNRRLVVLPIAFSFKDVHGAFDARVTYEGEARLRRYR